MQAVKQTFIDAAQRDIRLLSWEVRASFDKTFDDNITFFTLDTSQLDGTDILAPDGGNTAQEWDKYSYDDYTSRVKSIEVTSEEVDPYSIVQSYADVVMNNYDDFFTPNSGSAIDQFILPRRPFRIFMGFGDSNIPQFVGLSDSMPEINKNSRTARFHLVDFLTFIFDKEVSETVIKLNISTGDAIAYLLGLVGLTSTQYSMDQTSFNRIPYFFVEKGTKVGSVIRKLMEAEQGRLFMDEYGIIKFLNRQNYSTTPVAFFDKSNTNDYQVSREDDIINSVKIECDILEQQSKQMIYTLYETVLIKAGATADVWVSYEDPVTSVTTPTYSVTETTDSYFTSTSDIGGSIANTDVSVSSISNFAKATKIVFQNTGSTDAYIYAMKVWGVPVKTVDTIVVEDQDATSIAKFEERRYEMQTKYIQNKDSAVSKAAIMIDDYKNYGSILEIDVKGNMALQIGDTITCSIDGYTGSFIIKKITNILSDRYIQRLKIKQVSPREYFILDVSQIDGTDALAP